MSPAPSAGPTWHHRRGAREGVLYGRLFGWEAKDVPAGDAGTYTMLRLTGRDVCTLYERGPEQEGPPAWLSYVSVAEAGEVTERARAAGATVVQDPFDVMDAGRMALIQDPAGAFLRLVGSAHADRRQRGQ